MHTAVGLGLAVFGTGEWGHAGGVCAWPGSCTVLAGLGTAHPGLHMVQVKHVAEVHARWLLSFGVLYQCIVQAC
jgi:hypothetical protein